ncbi:MAG: hypothetical protein R2704_16755 [Microthrixaceae bacterium]
MGNSGTANLADSAREWFSLDDDEGTWLFDVTFLASSWRCIWGGCPGIEPEPDQPAGLGCCTHGAHFADDEDRRRVRRSVDRLGPTEWQHRPRDRRTSPFVRTDDGWATKVSDGACIFLNRPNPADDTTPGCVLHAAAVTAGERPLDWKPEVCWQLPLRLEHHTDESGAELHTLREWRRRDWGEGGAEFGWWCTEEHEAFSGHSAVYESLGDELIEMIGAVRYRTVADHLDRRRGVGGAPAVADPAATSVMLSHPAVRR